MKSLEIFMSILYLIIAVVLYGSGDTFNSLWVLGLAIYLRVDASD